MLDDVVGRNVRRPVVVTPLSQRVDLDLASAVEADDRCICTLWSLRSLQPADPRLPSR